MKIKLTPEQQRKRKEYYQKFVTLNYSVERLDLEEVIKCCKEIAKYCEIKEKISVEVLPSPLACQIRWNKMQDNNKTKLEFDHLYYSPLHWLGYITNWDYVLTELLPPEVKESFPKLAKILKWHQHLHYLQIINNTFLVSDRPTVIKRDAKGFLHNDSGPALEYADGFSIHAIHGEITTK
jgi:hypothetical protein